MCCFVIHSMDPDLSESVIDIPSKKIEVLEKNLGEWWEEVWFSGIILAFVFIQSLALAYSFGITRRRYVNNVIRNDSSDLSSRIFRNYLFANGFFLLVLVIIIIILLSHRKRYYIIFSLQSDSAEESEFSLSSFTPLFSRENMATRIMSKNHSSLSRKLDVPSNNDKELLLDKFRIKMSGERSSHIGLFYNIFIIAFDENDNSNNTFIFYSRRESTWKKIRQYLVDEGCTIEVQHRQEVLL